MAWKMICTTWLTLLFAGIACANVVCFDGVCRTVETGPLQESSSVQPKADVKRGAFARTILWPINHWKPITAVIVPMASSASATYEAHECRERKNAGIAFCEGGYGEFAAREGVRAGVSFTMAMMSLYGLKHHYKEWALPFTGWSAFNIYTAIHESQIGCPVGTHPVYGTKYNCSPNYSW